MDLGWHPDAKLQWDRLELVPRLEPELSAIEDLCWRVIDDLGEATEAADQIRGDDGAIRWRLETRTRYYEPCIVWHLENGQPVILWIGNADFTELA